MNMCHKCDDAGRRPLPEPEPERESHQRSAYTISPSEGRRIPHWHTPDQSNVPQRLPEGTPCLIVDTGAWSNVIGADAAKDLALRAMDAGIQVHQNKLSCPLSVSGIGSENMKSYYEASLPVRLQEANGGPNEVHMYEAPVLDSPIEGSSEAICPAVIGLKALESINAIIETTAGDPMLHVPGIDGYRIEFAPGARHFPLQKSPTGQLVLPIQALQTGVSSSGEPRSEVSQEQPAHRPTTQPEVADPEHTRSDIRVVQPDQTFAFSRSRRGITFLSKSEVNWTWVRGPDNVGRWIPRVGPPTPDEEAAFEETAEGRLPRTWLDTVLGH